MKLTDAQRRGLEAVRGGKAYRVYRNHGNTMHAESVGAATLWKLESLRLIGDGRPNNPGAIQVRVPLELTDAGRKALWHEEA